MTRLIRLLLRRIIPICLTLTLAGCWQTTQTVATPAPIPSPRPAVITIRPHAISPRPTIRPTRSRQIRKRMAATPRKPEANVAAYVALGRRLNAENGWSQHWSALYELWRRESGWRPWAVNRKSGACGIPQFHPCLNRHRKRAEFQIRDGLAHIARKHRNPSRALAHFKRRGWY